jgi:anti-anti-sigma regulatory factor
MEFKIDTKSTYTNIKPVTGRIDANLTDTLAEKLRETGQTVRSNYIIDLSSCQNMDADAPEALVSLHEICYSNESSLVFTGLNASLLKQMKSTDAGMILNLAPTLQEAIDIISMEILERDLFNDEA